MLKYLKKINPFKEPDYDHLSDKELDDLWRKSIDRMWITETLSIVAILINICVILFKLLK
ncbi:hypothetical protein CMU21_15965 [Elizabethkingia anophelis]|nr:hypothetical protein [Elizabethkingia anophelis]